MKINNFFQIPIVMLLLSGVVFFNFCKFISVNPKYVTANMVTHFDYFTFSGYNNFYTKKPNPVKHYSNPIISGRYSTSKVSTSDGYSGTTVRCTPPVKILE